MRIFPASHVCLRTCTSGWWFGTFFIFPYIGNTNLNWLIFFRGVETTNQTLFGIAWKDFLPFVATSYSLIVLDPWGAETQRIEPSYRATHGKVSAQVHGPWVLQAPFLISFFFTVRFHHHTYPFGTRCRLVESQPKYCGVRSWVSASKLASCFFYVTGPISLNSVRLPCCRVVQGAVEETTALLNNRWDHIFYTGFLAQCD